jgi:hypothetical protein
MEALIAVLYRSEAMTAEDGDADKAILAEARKHNAACNVTGFLYRESNIFYQWLEGPPAAVIEVFRWVAQDPRHRDVCKLSEITIAERYFPSWTMGYAQNDSVSLFDWAADNDISLRTIHPTEILHFLLYVAGNSNRAR